MRQSSYPGSHGQNRTVPSKHQQTSMQKQPSLFANRHRLGVAVAPKQHHFGSIVPQNKAQKQALLQHWQQVNQRNNKSFAPSIDWIQENPPKFPKEALKWRPPLKPYDPDNPWTNCESFTEKNVILFNGIISNDLIRISGSKTDIFLVTGFDGERINPATGNYDFEAVASFEIDTRTVITDPAQRKIYIAWREQNSGKKVPFIKIWSVITKLYCPGGVTITLYNKLEVEYQYF